MSLLTSFLKLFKWNTSDAEDLEKEFDIDKAMNDNWDNIEANAKSVNDRLEAIDNEQDTQDTEIAKLQNRVQQLQANMINETTDEATSLHVTNVAELPAKLSVRGNHKQETREGYSLVDISSLGSGTLQGVSYSVEDDVVTLNGAYTGSSAIPLGSLINSIPRKNATFRLQLVPVSGSSENSNIGIRFNKQNGSGQNEQLNYIQLAGTQNNFATKTMDLTELSTVNFFFASKTNATFNNYKFKLMLTEGAEEKEYEPYGVSPSTSYPSEIKTVGDNINIFDGETETGGYSANTGNKNPPDPATIRNVNFINVENLNTVMFSCDGESIAMNVFEYDTDKTFIKMTFNAVDNPFKLSENTAFINFSRSNNIDASKIKIEAGTEITAYSPHNQGSSKITKTNSNVMPIVSLGTDWEYTETGIKNLSSNSGKTITRLNLKKGQTIKFGFKLFSKPSLSTTFTFYVDGKENVISSFSQFNNYTLNQLYQKTYTATEDCKITIILWGNDFGGSNYSIFEFQLWANLEEQEYYVQYAEENYALPIQKPMLQGDYFIKEADGWKEVHKYEKVYLSELDWQISANELQEKTFDFVVMYSNSNLSSDEKNCLCNCFNSETANFVYANDVEGIAQSKSQIMIRISKNVVTGLDDFKTLLAEKNAYAYIQPQNPTQLTCTEAQSQVLDKLAELPLFKGTNNITTAENLAIMQMTYTVDMKAYIDSKIGGES